LLVTVAIFSAWLVQTTPLSEAFDGVIVAFRATVAPTIKECVEGDTETPVTGMSAPVPWHELNKVHNKMSDNGNIWAQRMECIFSPVQLIGSLINEYTTGSVTKIMFFDEH
jgi:hypothetical protein